MPNYITLFVGILFANILLLFGIMMTPLLDHYQNEIQDKLIAKHQYVLKVPVEVDNEAQRNTVSGHFQHLRDV